MLLSSAVSHAVRSAEAHSPLCELNEFLVMLAYAKAMQMPKSAAIMVNMSAWT
jgi:hypothetical protein